MLSMDAIQPTQTWWASATAFVPKVDTSLYFGVDYRKLNAVKIQTWYQIPPMNECIDFLSMASKYLTLDAKSKSWIAEMSQGDCEDLGLTSLLGLFRASDMEFPVKNAPGTFQQAMDIQLSNVEWQFAFFCWGHIVIFSRNPDERIDHVQQHLCYYTIRSQILTLKKCKALAKFMDYHDHAICPGPLKVSKRIIGAICGLQHLGNVTERRSF